MRLLNHYEVELYVDYGSWLVGISWLGYKLHEVEMRMDVVIHLLCFKVMIRT